MMKQWLGTQLELQLCYFSNPGVAEIKLQNKRSGMGAEQRQSDGAGLQSAGQGGRDGADAPGAESPPARHEVEGSAVSKIANSG